MQAIDTRPPTCPDCLGPMTCGRRISGTGLVTRVRICWECGRESPPFYRRSEVERNACFRRDDQEAPDGG